MPITSATIANTCHIPSRSPRSGTANSTTQISNVLWMNAALVEDARDSPSKKRTKATAPPSTPITPRPHHCIAVAGRVTTCRPLTPAFMPITATTATITMSATQFFNVV